MKRMTVTILVPVLLGMGACGSDDSKAEPVSASGQASPTVSASPNLSVTPAAPSQATAKKQIVKVRFLGKVYRYRQESCSSTGKTGVELRATGTAGAMLTVSAVDMKGTLQAAGEALTGGSLDMEGQVKSVVVRDTGRMKVKGRGSVADDSANESGRFVVKGWCR